MLRVHGGTRTSAGASRLAPARRHARRRVSRYVRTRLATKWSPDSRAVRVVRWLLTRVVPVANPDYPFVEVREWLVEFDDDGRPHREIGLDARGKVVLAGPDDRNRGFWLDADMRFADFGGEEIDAAVFEEAWRCWLAGPRFRTR